MITVDKIADALAAQINAATAGTFSQTFTAVVKMLPKYTNPEMATLHVTVVPAAIESEGATRSECQDDLSVDIAVQKQVTSATLETDVKALMKLTGELVTYLRRRGLSTQTSAKWLRLKNEPVYSIKHLVEMRVFTSVIRTTYRVVQ